MRILIVSDLVEKNFPHNGTLAGQFDLVVSCGDLPPYYLAQVASSCAAPLYGLPGNHDHGAGWDGLGRGEVAAGEADLDGRVLVANGVLLAGAGGSPRYSAGPHQHSEFVMALRLLRLVPGLLVNRVRHGRWLDLLVTHAPPRGIHDREDRTHRGFRALRPFLRFFRPRYHLHGHVHAYDSCVPSETLFGATMVLNTYGHREIAW